MLKWIAPHADRTKCFVALIVLFLMTPPLLYAQRLEQFGSDSGKRESGGITHRIPYEKVISYFDFIDKDHSQLSSHKGQEEITFYFYLEDSLTELGLRVLSPVPELVTPKKGNYATNAFLDSSKNKNIGFDPVLKIKRSKSFVEKADLGRKDFIPDWVLLGENDNQNEMFRKEYALIRLVATADQNVLCPGLYCITITASKESLRGSFLLQIGYNPAGSTLQLKNKWQLFVPE